MNSTIARRQFLHFLAASPLVAALGNREANAAEDLTSLPDYLIKAPQNALDVFDMHAVAKDVLPTSHYGYLATGTDGNETLAANRKAFERIYLRAMRMVDTKNIDMSTRLLGTDMPSPLVLAPVGSQNAFHATGELGTAIGASRHNTLQLLSNVATHSIEAVIAARGAPVGFQLYPTRDWSIAKTMIQRAEKAGAKILILTVDLNSGSNRVLMGQYARADERDCSACHGSGPNDWLKSKPMYEGTATTSAEFDNPAMTWEFVERLQKTTTMKVVVKGIVSAEDASSCVAAGADAVYVSNHGGRAEASGWGAIDSLPQVVAAVKGKVPVLVDSGFRRGTDIFKALALGADAVCIGRAYIWGLAAFGADGVDKVIAMLNAELAMVMGQMGAASLKDIGPQHIGTHS